MTYEEAIKVLTDTRVMILKGSGTDLAKACSMAIEALEKQISLDKIVAKLEVEKAMLATEEYCKTKGNCFGVLCFECCADHLIKIVKAGGTE